MEKLIASCGRIILIYVVTFVALTIIRRILKRIQSKAVLRENDPVHADEVSKRYGTILQLVYQILRVLLWGIAVMIILRELGIDIAPFLASAGVVGLAVGFGAQNLVRDFVTGFFLIIENQIRVGDTVTINGTSGSVEKISLRTISLRDINGSMHILPNGTINMVSNSSQQYSYFVFTLGVAYKENTDNVIDVIKEVCRELATDPLFTSAILDVGEVFGLDSFGDSAILIKGRIKTIPGKQWYVGREFNRRIKQAFELNNVEIPYPTQSILMKNA
jgi:small conductance mechanosensitive channel